MAKLSESAAVQIEEASVPLRTVLLLHDLPDGSSHVDWMLAKDSQASSSLITYRLAARVDELTVSAPGLVALHIPNHRAKYLEYEGPISGNRGRVRRLNCGWIVRQAEISPNETRMTINWNDVSQGAVEQELRIHRQNPTHSLIFCDSIRRCTSGRDF